MDRPSHEQELAQIMADRTGTRPEDWFFVYRARHGMQVAFEALRHVRGAGEVATQLFTCCTAVDPILAAGLEPRYGELSAATCALDPACLEVLPATRSVVAQHTFGIVDDASTAALAARAHGVGALVVEDCAHCVARMAKGADGAPVADVSVHSFGVEKTLHTFFGGAVWVNPASPASDVVDELRRRLAALPAAAPRAERLNRSYASVNRVLVHLPASVSRPLRRGLAKAGLFDPAVSDDERRGRVSEKPARITEHAARAAVQALGGLDANYASRAAAVGVYCRELSGVPGVEIPAAAVAAASAFGKKRSAREPQPLLRMPILLPSTEQADAVERAVLDAGFYTTAWYRPELGPGVLDEEAYRVPKDRSALTVNDRLVACVANLPTDAGADGAVAVARAVRSVVLP